MVIRGSRAGFTLVEAMLTVAILGLLASAGATLFIQAQRYFLLTKARVSLQSEARGVMYLMTRELRQAQSQTIVISRASNSQPYFSQIAFTTQQGAARTFLQTGNVLQMKSGGQVKILSKNLRYLAFTFPRSDDMTIVSISMTLQTSSYEGKTKALHMASDKVEVMN